VRLDELRFPALLAGSDHPATQVAILDNLIAWIDDPLDAVRDLVDSPHEAVRATAVRAAAGDWRGECATLARRPEKERSPQIRHELVMRLTECTDPKSINVCRDALSATDRVGNACARHKRWFRGRPSGPPHICARPCVPRPGQRRKSEMTTALALAGDAATNPAES